MKVPESIAVPLAREEWDEVEAEWLVCISEHPENVEWFSAAAEGIRSVGEDSRARTLLELLDEQLREKKAWEARLELIRNEGKNYLKTGRIFEAVVDSVKALYADRQDQLDYLLETVGLTGSRDETPKLWDKVERLRSLFNYTPGTIVWMKDKGVGSVVDVNMSLQTLKIDFEKYEGLSVGFRAAGKMLEILPDGHILRRKLEQPDVLEKYAPSELLRATLESYDRPLTGAEVREVVAGLVPEKKWSSWWTSARKHPQVVVQGGKKQAYQWAKSEAHAQDAVWDKFHEAPANEKLDLLRRAGNQDAELLARMATDLAATGRGLVDEQPALAFEIWQSLDKMGAAPSSWSPTALVTGESDPRQWISQLGTRTLREQAYRLTRSERKTWVASLQAAFLDETDPKALEVLTELLGESSAEDAAKAVDQGLSQPRKTPAQFTYAAERAAEDESLRERRGVRLLKQILNALGDPGFDAFHTRLGVLADTGGTLPRLLPHLDLEGAAEAEKAILEARGLEDYRRDPLLEAIRLRFPDLRKQDESPLYTTAEMLEAKQLEMKTLHEKEIPANRKAIEVAREMGDLRENFEYKAARQRHEYLAVRAGNLHQQLERAKVLDPDTIDTSEVRVGTRVHFEGEGNGSVTILGPWESEPDAGIISFESEAAQALIGKKVGDEVALSGETARIEAIEVWTSQEG